MKAQELRLGNLLSYNGHIVEVSNIGVNGFETTKDGVLYGSCDLESYKPIPLTEQWLIDFGFEKKVMFHKGNLSIVQKGELGYLNGRTYFNSWTILEHQPESVHQLQNLYFALTGEELQL